MKNKSVTIQKIKNFFFCLQYPFYKCYSLITDEFLGYEFTWYDDIPEGWQKAFGRQLSKDLKKALKKAKELRSFRFLDIKEKWGSLRMYAFSNQEVYKVFDSYGLLSSYYCMICGEQIKEHDPSGICQNCRKKFFKSNVSH